MTQINRNDKITAQMSETQSNVENKVFGCLTEEQLTAFSKNLADASDCFMKDNFVYSYIKNADRILSKARLGEDQKDVIRGAFSMVLSVVPEEVFINREHYEHTAEYYYPEDLETQIELLENGEEGCEFEDKKEIADTAIQELGYVITDWTIEDITPYYPEDFSEAYDIIGRYIDVINECSEDGVPEWLHSEIQELCNQYEDYI